nr:ABC transporter ATP-binding protein [Chitinophagaceae bacterium]
MKILLLYLKPYRWLVALTLLLAAVNTGFSLMDPIIFGKLIRLATDFKYNSPELAKYGGYFWSFNMKYPGVAFLLALSIAVAMISRIAKNFQDYFLNVVVQKFGAKVFTDGLKHAMKLPYQEFEDQRSGETLSVLTKVRTDTEKFMNYLINILFGVLVGVVFVCVYAGIYINWLIPVAYFTGILLLTTITNLLSKKIKIIQKNIVSQTNSLAGSTTESLRNIELVKSLGLTFPEIRRLRLQTQKIFDLEMVKVKKVRSLSFL